MSEYEYEATDQDVLENVFSSKERLWLQRQ